MPTNHDDKRDEVIARLTEALRFYADPDNYLAIGFFPDRPCGAFMDDFSDDHNSDYTDLRKPGALARKTLREVAFEIKSDRTCEVHQAPLVFGYAEFCVECETKARE
jgi:hypothetical protein